MTTQAEIIKALIDLWSKDPTLASVPIRRMAEDAALTVEGLENAEKEIPVVEQVTVALVVIFFVAAILAALGVLK